MVEGRGQTKLRDGERRFNYTENDTNTKTGKDKSKDYSAKTIGKPGTKVRGERIKKKGKLKRKREKT